MLPNNGICGWVAAEAGSGVDGGWACQSFGLIMPAIVFFVAYGVILITLFFLIRYALRFSKLMAVLDQLQGEIDKLPQAPPGEWPSSAHRDQLLAMIQSAGSNLPPLQSGLERLRSIASSIAFSGKGDATKQTVLNEPASVAMGGPHALDHWVGKSLADVLPGWLSGVGLLTTFLALLLGLQNVHVLSSLEVRGIGGLVNGLSGKFFSSIASLGCSIIVSIANYFMSRCIEQKWANVMRTTDAILPSLTMERIFMELLKHEAGSDKK